MEDIGGKMVNGNKLYCQSELVEDHIFRQAQNDELRNYSPNLKSL